MSLQYFDFEVKKRSKQNFLQSAPKINAKLLSPSGIKAFKNTTLN